MSEGRFYSYTIELLERIAEFIEDYSDVRDSADGPVPNEAMSILMVLESHIEKLKRLSHGPSNAQLHNLDGQDFYELCQRYRHARDIIPLAEEYPTASEAFEDIKTFIRTGKLPFKSYEQDEASSSAMSNGGTNG